MIPPHHGLVADNWHLVKHTGLGSSTLQWYYSIGDPPRPNRKGVYLAQINSKPPVAYDQKLICITTRMVFNRTSASRLVDDAVVMMERILNDYPVDALYAMPRSALDTIGYRPNAEVFLKNALYRPLFDVASTVGYLVLNGRIDEVPKYFEEWSTVGKIETHWRVLADRAMWSAAEEVMSDTFVLQSTPVGIDSLLTQRYASPLLLQLWEQAEQRQPLDNT